MSRLRPDPGVVVRALDDPALGPLRAAVAALAARPEPEALLGDGPPVGWDRLRPVAARHKAAALLAFVVGRGLVPADALAPEVVEELRVVRRRAQVRTLSLVARTAELQAALDRSGVRSLVIKGPVLSQQLHGDPAARGAGDIDLVVDRDDAVAAEATLIAAGYVRTAEGSGPVLPAAPRHLGRHALSLSDGSTVVDLHWRLEPEGRLLPPSLVPVIERRVAVRVAEADLWTLPAEDMSFLAVVHAARSGWMRLKWVADAAVLLEANDPAPLVARARRTGQQRALASLTEVLGAVIGTARPQGAVALHVLDALTKPRNDPRIRIVGHAVRLGHLAGPRDLGRVVVAMAARRGVGPVGSARDVLATRVLERRDRRPRPAGDPYR